MSDNRQMSDMRQMSSGLADTSRKSPAPAPRPQQQGAQSAPSAQAGGSDSQSTQMGTLQIRDWASI